ncbi:MAG: DUF1987 domain-containing protein [Bacteroidia bacterium]
MKSNLLYELSTVYSYFLRINEIESVDLRYLGFFYKDYEKQGKLGKLLNFRRPGSQEANAELMVSEWRNVSKEEFSFCLSRLSKYLSHKEKVSFFLVLFDSCHYNSWVVKERLEFVQQIAEKLSIDLAWLPRIKKLSTLQKDVPDADVTDGKILFVKESEFYPWRDERNSNEKEATQTLFTYIYFQESMLAFVKPLNTAKMNGFVIEPGKLYPMTEGDVLSCNDKVISFNGVFRHYFSSEQFRPLVIEATETTPFVQFDGSENKLEISGCCVPENGMEFYARLYKWLDSYLITRPRKITVNIRLDYFNTTSSKCILDLLFRLQRYKTDEVDLRINWFFQDGDGDLEEAGVNYSEIVKLPFSLIAYS